MMLTALHCSRCVPPHMHGQPICDVAVSLGWAAGTRQDSDDGVDTASEGQGRVLCPLPATGLSWDLNGRVV